MSLSLTIRSSGMSLSIRSSMTLSLTISCSGMSLITMLPIRSLIFHIFSINLSRTIFISSMPIIMSRSTSIFSFTRITSFFFTIMTFSSNWSILSLTMLSNNSITTIFHIRSISIMMMCSMRFISSSMTHLSLSI